MKSVKIFFFGFILWNIRETYLLLYDKHRIFILLKSVKFDQKSVKFDFYKNCILTPFMVLFYNVLYKNIIKKLKVRPKKLKVRPKKVKSSTFVKNNYETIYSNI